MKGGIFITGTGTDVGKTYVTASLVAGLRKKGVDAGYYKAVLSGLEEKNGRKIPGDAAYVYDRAGIEGNPFGAVGMAFDYPASPHLAAKIEGRAVSLEPIVAAFDRIAENHSYVVAEGSGGLICPLRLGKDPLWQTDVIHRLGFEALLVADAGLGTINHTLLTLEHAEKKKISIRAVVLNCFEKDNLIHEDNKKVIEELCSLPVFTCPKNGEVQKELMDFLGTGL